MSTTGAAAPVSPPAVLTCTSFLRTVYQPGATGDPPIVVPGGGTLYWAQMSYTPHGTPGKASLPGRVGSSPLLPMSMGVVPQLVEFGVKNTLTPSKVG